ncbi:MAG: uracil-DNA glycosylase family protein [Verrucomicrobia bacterium]|nr:uracil-DNA glycosylase family protein [Verrucomicrobiota bacterium]
MSRKGFRLNRQTRLQAHVESLSSCRHCSKMHSNPVSGGPVVSRVMLVGQAPGAKEPVLGRPFAWTAGKAMFKWFEQEAGVTELEFRRTVYMAAVCRCFPGKNSGGGDRVPSKDEVSACSEWLRAEISILRPGLVIAVGKLAIIQFLPEVRALTELVGQLVRVNKFGHTFDLAPLPHPSGASPWHRIEPGKTLTKRALSLITNHPAWMKRV